MSQDTEQGMNQGSNESSNQDSNQSTPEESSTNQESQDTPYGLTGSYNPNIEDSFTIVLYSLSNVQNALTQRDQLQAQSYRAFARERTLNSGTMTTQVCVGQFERFEDAVNAANASFGEAGINFFISAHSQSILE
jgi:cell division septation protein DedD